MFPTRIKIAAIAVALSLAGLGAATLPGAASTFESWQVAHVDWNDTLNVRKYPAPFSAKQAAYPNGTVLSLTGRCTGGMNLKDISWKDKWDKASAVRFRWCEVWHDPARDGNFVTGWVYGKYIRPN